jgi:hypothetical protein
MPHPVLDAAQQYRSALLARESARSAELTRAYGRAYRAMQEQIRALEQQVATLDSPSRAQVTRLASLRSLVEQASDQVNRFAVYADQSIANAASQEIVNGLRESRAVVDAYFATPQAKAALRAAWAALPAESVETMLGFVGDDSPLRQVLVNRLGPAVAERLSNALVDAITLGMNPRLTAALIRRELGVGLTWALTTARTAQLWAYRESTRANYVANSNIVESWTWLAALDDRCCLSCIAQHGGVHPVSDVLNDHHNGRCVPIPNVRNARQYGISQPTIESGEWWFNSLTPTEQAQRMGPSMYAAWRAGEFRFSELSQPYNDPIYGPMLGEASLIGLLGGRAREYYVNQR